MHCHAKEAYRRYLNNLGEQPFAIRLRRLQIHASEAVFLSNLIFLFEIQRLTLLVQVLP